MGKAGLTIAAAASLYVRAREGGCGQVARTPTGRVVRGLHAGTCGERAYQCITCRKARHEAYLRLRATIAALAKAGACAMSFHREVDFNLGCVERGEWTLGDFVDWIWQAVHEGHIRMREKTRRAAVVEAQRISRQREEQRQ